MYAWMFAALTAAPLTAFGDSAVRVGTVQAPAGTDARTRAALGESLQRHIAQAQLGDSLKPYTIAPSLVQLRRYVEDNGPKQGKLVCVVDLALVSRGNIVASVRGNVTGSGAARRDVIDAAAQAAVSRLPEALQALDGSRKKAEQVAAR